MWIIISRELEQSKYKDENHFGKVKLQVLYLALLYSVECLEKSRIPNKDQDSTIHSLLCLLMPLNIHQ